MHRAFSLRQKEARKEKSVEKCHGRKEISIRRNGENP